MDIDHEDSAIAYDPELGEKVLRAIMAARMASWVDRVVLMDMACITTPDWVFGWTWAEWLGRQPDAPKRRVRMALRRFERAGLIERVQYTPNRVAWQVKPFAVLRWCEARRIPDRPAKD